MAAASKYWPADGARIDRAILDVGAEVGEGATVGKVDGELALVGQRVKIPAGERIAAGARVEPAE